MNHIIAKAVGVPLQVKVEVLNSYPQAKAGNNEAMYLLFKVYKAYFSDAPAEEHFDCEGCRLRAWRTMQQIVRHWRAGNE